MSKELLGVSALGLMVVGEFCAIYSEVVVAKLAQTGSASWGAVSFPLALMCFAGICLLAAYWLGYVAVGDIWIVTVVSVTSLLLLEPVVVWSLFHETPGRGALIGFVLGALGMLSTALL
ncbi:hypothetical protein E3Z27_18500 [Pseudomonas mediterranea]|uniref:EamA domain-containing protein n=1 Tax=Pseudomonas mediterranea TaxID=183795 RepID=A0AAX2DBB4_9PSED|nr:hypothetical protein [Pseudomonas mediterranea]MDU9030855.1 hypothetical protein [Pseudomonas mediterranea]QHA83530.1 hypothetical protein E3Z27_18500 [Pseudomonas mediterranea]CAH0204554.1 hypothetical protein SRABI112_01978 [Pseudomonas mediterranea]SDU48681.1 hypothetical protein SAMN05216476_2502 [Pseudomonas mediterranea]